MNKIINLELISDPLNWIIVFLVLYALALASHYVITSLAKVGISFGG